MVHKMVDVFNCKPGSILIFCKILDENYFSLAEEMRAEMKAEKGELKIEDYIYEEAGKLVLKDFGNTKRLSDGEKKDMQALVALRTQYAKEVWRLRLERARKELADLLKANREKDEQAAEMVELVGKFVKDHRKKVNKRNATTSDPPKLMSREKTMTENMKTGKLMMETLEEHVSSLLALTTQSLQEKEILSDERGRALGELGLDDKNAELDEELRLLMAEMEETLRRKSNEADSKEQMAKSLNGQIRNMEDEASRELNERKKTIGSLNKLVAESESQLSKLEKEGQGLKSELNVINVELEKIKAMVLHLDRTKRLGFKIKGNAQLLDSFNSSALKAIQATGTSSYETVTSYDPYS